MLQFSGNYVDGPGTNSFTYPRISSINRPEETDSEFIKKQILQMVEKLKSQVFY